MYHVLRLRSRRRSHIRREMISNVIHQTEIPSWVRRGHTRKPNFVVRFLYWLFDWFGDFGPMLRSFGRGIGKTARGTWGFLVRAVLITINILLMAGIIYVSAGHSYEMLIYGGMSGTAALVFVAVWETAFIYCSILIDLDHYKGKKSGWAPWVTFLMGFAFVVISNYLGMADNIIGRAIGISTPILLLMMKKVLAYQFQAKKEKTSWFSILFNLIKSKRESKKGKDEHQPAIQKQDAKAGADLDAKMAVEPDAQTDAKVDTEAGGKMDVQSGVKADTKTDGQAGAQTGVKLDAGTGADAGVKMDTKPDAEADADDGVKVDAQAGKKMGVKKTSTKKGTTDADFKKVKRWAKKFQAENGKLPGRVEIQKKFDFTKSLSSKFAAMLKEELADKVS
ncbi:hypothetical protein [Thermoactinomyces sp. CICC 10521]|uniref:hypothetical protein n=1 Tax=Thermoactinomyces sp. CICC 10521 TaxID=2767426 RepID=UPI0018DDAF26|nr:hypothetical protein [Thermoactinomyces sp. CICC 10521]MBH8609375.1 hypothetical protein [Thermoactinomyces sp. CICC 10521]